MLWFTRHRGTETLRRISPSQPGEDSVLHTAMYSACILPCWCGLASNLLSHTTCPCLVLPLSGKCSAITHTNRSYRGIVTVDSRFTPRVYQQGGCLCPQYTGKEHSLWLCAWCPLWQRSAVSVHRRRPRKQTHPRNTA